MYTTRTHTLTCNPAEVLPGEVGMEFDWIAANGLSVVCPVSRSIPLQPLFHSTRLITIGKDVCTVMTFAIHPAGEKVFGM